MGESVVKTHEKMASALSQAKDMKAVSDKVRIPVKDISDGKLHRFAFTASDGTKIRFIIIHKGSGVYVVAFDFCDICG